MQLSEPKWILAFAIGVISFGCGGPSSGPVEGPLPPTLEQAMKPKSTDELKTRLNEIASSGQGGSGVAGIRPALEDLKASNPGLATELISDCAKLEVATKPEEIKSIAKKMADKL